MIFQIDNVLTQRSIDKILESLCSLDLWLDGRGTAKGRAKLAKVNLQADPKNAGVYSSLNEIKGALASNAMLKAIAFPAEFSRVLFSRYDIGMSYGTHVDAPYIDNTRSDLSFTLFLSDPENYDGGELVIERSGKEHRVKLSARSLIVYQSRTLHRVQQVTR
ncbi:MAG: Fe2+-dependent dioxygenase, partial [Pseudomonadota bacterium]